MTAVLYTCKAINDLGEAQVDCKLEVKGECGPDMGPAAHGGVWHLLLGGLVRVSGFTKLRMRVSF